MTRQQRRYDQQTSREVHRAELLVAEVENTSEAQAAQTLRGDAAVTGVSVHAAALAALAAGPRYTSDRAKRGARSYQAPESS